MNTTILIKIHPVIGEEHDLGFITTERLYLLQDLIKRLERGGQTLWTANVKQPVRAFQERKVIPVLRRCAESLVKSPHIGAPDFLRRHVHEELKSQRLLVVELIHV